MVKPVFTAIHNIKAAATPENAQVMAMEFITSEGAARVNGSQAGQFLNEVEGVFLKFNDPYRYQMFLAAIQSPLSKASRDLKQFAKFKEIDFKSLRAQAADIAQNYKVIRGVLENQPS